MNLPQKRRIAATFQHVDKLLQAAVAAVTGQGTDSPFNGVLLDATPEQRRRVLEGARRTRERMTSALDDLGIPIHAPQIPASRSAYTDLVFAEVDIEDIAPKRLGGYGPLAEEDARTLEMICADLLAILEPVRAVLTPDEAEDLR